MVADAAGRRRRKHADPLRGLPRRGAARALALCHRAPVHRRRARRRAAQPARAARLRLRGPRRLDRLLDRARSSSPSGRRWPSRYLGHEMLAVGPGHEDRAWRSATTTRARSAPTGSSTRSPIRERFGGPAVCVDFGTATTFDVVSREGEYVGGALMTGIEISLEALSERGARAAQGRPRAAAQRDRQEHDRRDPLGRRVRLRGRDRRDPAPPATTSSASAPT